MKKFIPILIVVFLSTVSLTHASVFDWINNLFNPSIGAPALRYERTILPETTGTYNLGSLANKWLNVYTNFASTTAISGTTVCIGSDCQTAWPAGGGTVTSVAMTVPTGLTISGSPITTSGTLALTLTAGYVIPLSASTTNWNTFYNTPSSRITAGTNLSWSNNTLNASGNGGTGVGTVSTSTTPTLGQLSYWTSSGAWPETIGTVATTTLTATSPLALSNPISVIGSAASALSIDLSGYIQVGTTSVASITTLSNLSITESQISDLDHYTDTDVSTYLTSGTGVDETTGTLSFDCSDVEGTGINCVGEAITLDNTGAWAGAYSNFGSDFWTYFSATTTDYLTQGSTNKYMTYPGAGIALSTGSAWDTSITNNSGNWNTAFGWGDHASAGYLLSVNAFTQAMASTTFVARNDWTTHDNYPTGCTNQFIRTIGDTLTCASVANTDLTNSTIGLTSSGSITIGTSPISLGGTSALNLNMANANTWTALQTFSNASTTLATITNLFIGGDMIDELVGAGLTLSSNALTVNDVTAAMLNAEDFGSFTCNGTNCTIDNTSITAAMMANADFGEFTCSSGTCTVDSGSILLSELGGGAAGANAYDFGGATSLEIPNAATPTVDAIGEMALDTTSGQLKIYNGSAVQVYKPERFVVFGYATSTSWTSTTTLLLAPAMLGETWNTIRCETNTGSVGVSVYDGTNRMGYFTASTTIGLITFSTNNSFTSGESRRVDFGTPATSPTKISCKASYGITAD